MTLDSLFRRFAFAPLPVPQDWFAIPLRLIVGFGFIQHGYAKLARGPDAFIVLHAIGRALADLLGWATIIVELVGGALILLGAVVPLATVPMIIVLLVAIFTVHLPNGLARSSSCPTTRRGRILASRAMRPTFCTSRACSRSAFGGAGPLSVDGYADARWRCARD